MAAPKNQGVLINKLRLGVKLSGEKKTTLITFHEILAV